MHTDREQKHHDFEDDDYKFERHAGKVDGNRKAAELIGSSGHRVI
jgi:hypothetical protein